MRNFKIGVMTDSFRTTFVDALDKAKELGAQGVQMYVTEGDMFYKNLTDERIEQAKRLLADESKLVRDVGQEVGFLTVQNFMWVFKSKTGVTPSEYRSTLPRKS